MYVQSALLEQKFMKQMRSDSQVLKPFRISVPGIPLFSAPKVLVRIV